MSETIKKLVFLTMVALVAATSLSACGKKGALENPDTEFPRKYPSR